MTKTAAKRLGLRYTSSNAQIKSVNASPTPIVGVAHGVNITVGDWQGKTKFIVAPINLFDVILGQNFFQQCHAVIDPHLQKLTIKEKGREYTVPMVKAQATEGQARVTAMKLERVDVRRRLIPAATIASSREDNGAGKSMPPRSKRVPSRNADMMKKPLEHLPPLKKEVRKIGSRKDGTSMKRLLEGNDRVRELMVAWQNSTSDAMRRGRCIIKWGSLSRPARYPGSSRPA